MEYYPGFQGDRIPIYAKIQMNLENIMLSEIKTQNTIYIYIIFHLHETEIFIGKNVKCKEDFFSKNQ